MDYVHRGWFMVRSPFLSLEQYANFCKSEIQLRAMLEDPVVSAAIKNAAPDLFFRLQDQLQKDRLDPELSASLFNITNRMTHRSVPNATYAGVSLGKIVATESSEILFHPQREYQIQRVIKKLELSRTSKKTKFILNPTAQFIHGVARFIPPLTPDDRKYKHSYVQLNHKLITYLEKKPNSLPFEIKMQLQQLGLLYPENRTKEPAFQKCDGYTLDSPPPVPPREIKNQNFIRSEMMKPTDVSSLSEKYVHNLMRGAHQLFSIFGIGPSEQNGSAALKNIRQEFHKRYHYNEVPLLELLDPDHPIGKKWAVVQKSSASVSEQTSALLNHLLIEHGVQNYNPIKLTSQSFDKAKQILGLENVSSEIKPESFSIVAGAVGSKENQKWHLRYVKGPQLTSHFVRYAAATDPAMKKNIRSLVQWEKSNRHDAITAEILHQADHPTVNNVTPELGLYEACIPVSSLSCKLRKTAIHLSDLRVSLKNGFFRLRCQRFNHEILPTLTNLHAPSIDSHPVYRFLCEVQVQQSFFELTWLWGPQSLSFYPRVESGSIILSPALWNLNSTTVQSLVQSANDQVQRLKLLTQLRIPTHFFYRSADGFIFVDTENELSFQSFCKKIKNKKTATIHEYFPPRLTQGPEGTFVNDFVIPIVQKNKVSFRANDYFFHPVAQQTIADRDRFFEPGSNWTYLKIEMLPIHYSQFLVSLLPKLLPPGESKWFIVPFNDTHFHVRLRIKSSDINGFIQKVRQKTKNSICSSFSVNTYEREISRYGGLLGCQLFESISILDSQTLIQIKSLALTSTNDKDDWLHCAFFSARQLMEAFELSSRELEEIRADYRSPEKSALPYKSEKLILKNLKLCFLTKINNHSDGFSSHRQLYESLQKKQSRLIRKVKTGISNSQIGITKKAFCTSLIHLSLVRLDLDRAQTFEPLIVSYVCDLLLIERGP